MDPEDNNNVPDPIWEYDRFNQVYHEDYEAETEPQWRPARMPRETDWNEPPGDWEAEDYNGDPVWPDE